MTGTRRALARIWPALVYGILGLLAHRQLAVAPASLVYDQRVPGHDSLLHVWTLAWGQRALWHQPTAPFDANVFHPHTGTLLYSDHLLGLAALLAPLRLLTADPVLIHNLALLATPVLNGLAMHALAYDLTRDRAAAFVAGLAYAFAPFRFAVDLNQIQMLVAWWPPLVLLGARRALATGRLGWAAVAAAALAMQGWTGIYLFAYFLPFLALVHLWWLRVFPLSGHARGWTALLGAEALAALALLPSALAYRGVQEVLGSARSPVLNALLSVTPTALLEALPVGGLALALLAALVARRHAPAPWRAEAPALVALAFGPLVLALGPSLTLPAGLGRIPGLYALLLQLPGIDALRAPGRMVHIGAIGLALLAAGGIAALRVRLRPAAFRAAVVLTLVLLAWNCHVPTALVGAAHPPPTTDPAYEWLAADPNPTPIVELPFGTVARIEQLYQFASVRHWRPMANGVLGIQPPIHAYLTRRLRDFPAPGPLDDLAALGIGHVVVHPAGMGFPAMRALNEASRGPDATLRRRHPGPRTLVYELAAGRVPAPVALGPALSRDEWQATATEDAAGAGWAIDGDPTTAWHSWHDLEHSLRRWYARDSFVAEWQAFLARQPARLAVDLGTTTTLGAVSMRLGGSDPGVVTLLAVEVSRDGEQWDAPAGELRAVPDVHALVTHAAEAHYAFVFEEPVRARHVRLACHGLDWRVGALEIHGAP